MKSVFERHLQMGGDPRTLADYAALRDELSKLTHPARPDVNWSYAEKLCLSLFEQNGIELQTAAWYTLVRMQLTGLSGMNEGLAILAALITRQWDTLWPPAVHARMEILSSLARRLQQHLRIMTLSYAQLSALYQAEQHLSGSGDALQHLALKHQAGLDSLCQQVHHAIVNLENSGGAEGNVPALPLAFPATAVLARDCVDDSRYRRVWVIPPADEPRIQVVSVPVRKSAKPFLAGMLTMLFTGTLILWGIQRFADNPNQKALMATVAPLPTRVSEASLAVLRQASATGRNPGETWLLQAQQQLDALALQSPVWSLNYGNDLVRQAQTLWPGRAETEDLTRQWQQQLEATAAPVDTLQGWQQGMVQLQQLTTRLNGLDERKGQYITVSELKSQVYAITHAFNQRVPVEELVRQLAAQSAKVPVPAALRAQTELNFKQLLARYVLLIASENPDYREGERPSTGDN